MQQRVFVVLAVRNGAAFLPDTLDALAAQTATPASIVAVDAHSSDDSQQLLTASDVVSRVVATQARTYGGAIRAGADALPAAQDGDWLWLLAHDAYPARTALEQLLATVETSPSVAVVGPKVLRAASPDTFSEFGETLTPFGRSVRLREGELDQGQYDGDADTLGTAESGVLIRRDVFERLGGFDPALPSIDSGLDLGIRARLAGHRVALQSGARIRRAGGIEHFAARGVADVRRTQVARAAQLHRRLAYAHPLFVVLHWLSLLPLAFVRSIGHLLAKRPASVAAEWAAALGAAMRVGATVRARRRIRAARSASWRDLAGLRASWSSLREHRLRLGDDVDANTKVVDERVGFVEGGGLWVAAFAAVVGVLLLIPLLGANAAIGGGLLPLEAAIGDVWSHALYGTRDALGAVVGPTDGFAIIVALLSSATFWSPSLALILVLFLALPLSAITGWHATRSVTHGTWLPAIGGVVWSLAPTLLSAVHDGRLGAVLAHIVLPVVFVGGMRAAQSWRSVGVAALGAGVAAAGAPVLVPALAIAWLVGVAWQWRAPRLLLAPIPALMLVGPTIWWQWMRGTPLAAFADPGIPLASDAPSVTDIVLLQADARLGGLDATVRALGLGIDAGWLAFAFAVPLLVVAATAPFLRFRGAPPLGLAALGIATALLATRIQPGWDGAADVAVWAGSGVSLALLGVLFAATTTLSVLDYRGGVAAGLITLAALVSAAPAIAVAFTSPPTLTPVTERSMPAFVAADASVEPHVGTLVIEPIDATTIQASIVRGAEETLEETSTLQWTSADVNDEQRALAEVAANLTAAGAIDVDDLLDRWGVRFVLLTPPERSAAALHDRAERSLEQHDGMATIGATDAGMLWQRDLESVALPESPPRAPLLLAMQLTAIAAAMLAALPSTRRGARSRTTRGALQRDWA